MPVDREKYILAIDLGTSGPKVGLVSSHGEVLGCETEHTPFFLFPNGGAEQRPDDWWLAIRTATHRLLGRGIAPVEDIVALSSTTQWSGTVAVDRAGKPLMNAIIWMDSRGAPYIQKIISGPLQIEGYALGKLITWLRLTGGVPAQSAKDPIAHILYIKYEYPEIYQQTYKFLEPKDYLNLRFTGKYAASFDSICLHWLTDNRRLSNVDYDDRLIRISEVDREKLPDLMRAVDILGTLTPECAADLGLSQNVKVLVGTPDVQSAAIGSGAVRDYEGHLYLGTSAWLACHVPFKKTDLFHHMASLPSAIPDRYLVTDEQESAGGCLNYLLDNILYTQDELSGSPRPADAHAALNRVAADVPAGSDRLIFTPWLYGERTPVDDHLVRGGFFNQSLKTTRSHMIRAVFEGVAYNSRWMLEYVEKFIKRPMKSLNIVGGGAISELWCQIHADVLGRTIRQVKDPVWANLRGAAFLAMVALGYLGFEGIPDCVQVVRTFEPDPANQKIYAELFREYVNIYKRNRPIYARLNASVK